MALVGSGRGEFRARGDRRSPDVPGLVEPHQGLELSCRNNLQTIFSGLANYASMNGKRLPTAKSMVRWRLPVVLGQRYARRATCRTSGRCSVLNRDLRRISKTHCQQSKSWSKLHRATCPACNSVPADFTLYVRLHSKMANYHAVQLLNRPQYALMSIQWRRASNGHNHGPARPKLCCLTTAACGSSQNANFTAAAITIIKMTQVARHLACTKTTRCCSKVA